MDTILKILTSLPIILLALYFVPVLGIFLLIIKLFIAATNKRLTYTSLITLGIILIVLGVLNKNSLFKSIPVLPNVLESMNALKYGQLLLIVGVIFLVISLALAKLVQKIHNFITSYITRYEQKGDEIRKENDLKMQEKREIAKNSHVVRCPHCGGDNMLTSKTGKCKFCRRDIS